MDVQAWQMALEVLEELRPIVRCVGLELPAACLVCTCAQAARQTLHSVAPGNAEKEGSMMYSGPGSRACQPAGALPDGDMKGLLRQSHVIAQCALLRSGTQQRNKHNRAAMKT